MTELNRRGFLLGLGAAIAAPAIVRASSIMPVKRLILPPPEWIVPTEFGLDWEITPEHGLMLPLKASRPRQLVRVDWHNLQRLG